MGSRSHRRRVRSDIGDREAAHGPGLPLLQTDPTMNVTLLTLSALAFSPWPAPLAAAVTPQAPVAEVLLTNVVGAERAEVPGLPGVMFEPGTGTTHFDRVYGHPGGHWILTARADLPPGEDECLIVNGTLVLREGDPAPWTGGSEDCGTLDRRCAINGSGDFVFATKAVSILEKA